MKIAIITFHWATNYGAVLQSFALQNYLSKQGHDVEIIDYYPDKYKKTVLNALKAKHPVVIFNRIKEIRKEKAIAGFRNNTLKMTEHFNSSEKLNILSENYDCFICGSDQIWNPSFTRFGEGKATFSYYLDFAPDNKILASYAASFGVTSYPEDLIDLITEKFKRFDFISVREKTGLDIVKKCGRDNVSLVPDPTLLLSEEDYLPFVSQDAREKPYAFSYMLHGMKMPKELSQYISDKKLCVVSPSNYTIEQWLTAINGAETVITNSFHGIVFSVLFKKKFIALTIDGSGMNDRIFTLLERLGLSDRIYKGKTADFDSKIDWQSVYEKLEELRKEGYSYLDKVINYEK